MKIIKSLFCGVLIIWVFLDILTFIAIMSLPEPGNVKEGKYAWGLAIISKVENGYISEGSFVFGTIKIGPLKPSKLSYTSSLRFESTLQNVKIYAKRVVNQQPIYLKYRIKYNGDYTQWEEWEKDEDGLYLFSGNDLQKKLLPYKGMNPKLQTSSIAMGGDKEY